MKREETKKKNKLHEKNNQRGITLIALVITIIVLIILAGISINLVLGENGLFNKARKAAEDYKQAAIDEQKMTNDLEEGIDKIANDNRPKTIEEAKDYGYFYEKTTLDDNDKNKIVIPAGFKIAEDSGDTVTDGIIIEDKDITTDGDGKQRGNQYVWIPVSNINQGGTNLIKKSSSEGKTEEIEITLGRYTFDNNGLEKLGQKAEDYADETKSTFTESKELDTYRPGIVDYMAGENRTAKDLAGFINSVKENGGYYIARYEASYGKDNKPNSKISNGFINENSSATKKEGYLWNNITQINAAEVCDSIYTTVQSDLVNSYAWDTAIVYIQKFSNDSDYSIKTAKKTTLDNTGKNDDEVCKINDMASNCCEWTTEYSQYTSNSCAYPCARRGGNVFESTNYTALRVSNQSHVFNRACTFRPILYIK